MDMEKIKAAIAPCGLNCKKCFAHANGEIRRLSLALKEQLGNFEPYARRFEALMDEPVFGKYPDFKEMLDFFADSHCQGCRLEQCKLFKNCGVRVCHQEKGLDFCFQCDEFPCDRTRFDPGLHKAWVLINEKIMRKGLEQYHEEAQARHRYP